MNEIKPNEVKNIHTFTLKKREILELSGIILVEHFNSQEFLMQSNEGWMLVKGNTLSLGKLDVNKQEVAIQGKIDSISYIEHEKPVKKETWYQKMLKG